MIGVLRTEISDGKHIMLCKHCIHVYENPPILMCMTTCSCTYLATSHSSHSSSSYRFSANFFTPSINLTSPALYGFHTGPLSMIYTFVAGCLSLHTGRTYDKGLFSCALTMRDHGRSIVQGTCMHPHAAVFDCVV